MASLSKCHRCPTTLSMWTTMFLYKWKLIHKGEIFSFTPNIITPSKKLKNLPLWINFHLCKTIVVQMPLLSNNDVDFDNDALNVFFNPQVPAPIFRSLPSIVYFLSVYSRLANIIQSDSVTFG